MITLVITAAFLLLAVCNHNTFVLAHDESTSFRQNSPRCGEVLTNSKGGSLLYKAFEPLSPNERCVWIIAAPKAVGYAVDVLHLGSPTNQDGSLQQLVITGVSYNSDTADESRSNERMRPPLLTSVRPTETGTIAFNNTNLVMITFASHIGEGNGFALEYHGIITEDGGAVSSNSTHHIIEHPTFDFIYPRNGGSYSDNELAAFVFIPSNNTFSNNKSLVSFKGLGDNVSGCVDFLYLYSFGIAQQSMWNYVTKGCIRVNRLEVANYDLTLILFKSIEFATAPGFRFHYVGCPL